MGNNWVSKEWVMLGTADIQKFYVGKICLDDLEQGKVFNYLNPNSLEESHIVRKLRHFVDEAPSVMLVEARMLISVIHMGPPGAQMSIGMQSLPMPISLCPGPATIRVRPTSVMFPNDMPGMTEALDAALEELRKMEMETNARKAGLTLATSIPRGRRQ